MGPLQKNAGSIADPPAGAGQGAGTGPGAGEAPADLDALATAATVLCCLLWAGNTVAVKFTVPDLPPFGSAGLRFVIALPVIGWACRRLGHSLAIRRRDWPLAGLHTILTTLQIGLFTWGTAHGLAGRSSIFVNVHPLVVAPLAWIFLGERMGVRGVMGLAAASAGLLALLWNPAQGSEGRIGDLVVLASGAVFGIQTIAQKKTYPRIPPTSLLFAQTVGSIPLFFLISWRVEGFSSYDFSTRARWGLAYQGLMVSGICFTVWMVLLRRYSASRISTIAFLTPIFGVALGKLIRSEPLTWPLILGGVLVGIGIYLVAVDRVEHRLAPVSELPGEDAP